MRGPPTCAEGPAGDCALPVRQLGPHRVQQVELRQARLPIDDRSDHLAQEQRYGPAQRHNLVHHQHAAGDLLIAPVRVQPPQVTAVVTHRFLAFLGRSELVQLGNPRGPAEAPGPASRAKPAPDRAGRGHGRRRVHAHDRRVDARRTPLGSRRLAGSRAIGQALLPDLDTEGALDTTRILGQRDPGVIYDPGGLYDPGTGTPRKSRPAGSRTSKPSEATSCKSHSNKHIPMISKSVGASPEKGLSYPERPPPGS